MHLNTQLTKQDAAKLLAEFWLPHLIATEDLFTHLEYVTQTLKEVRRDALKAELHAFDDLLKKEVPKEWKFKEYRRRTIVTLLGEITYTRRIYQEPCGICHALLDEILGIRTRMKLAPDAFLWIAKKASDISFRKTVEAFFEFTGAKISHWLVMQVIHEEGALILKDAYSRAFGADKRKEEQLPLIASETLFVEFDGICIALQKDKHDKKKSRRIYEAEKKKKHFELKVGCFYAGKNEKRERLGLAHFASGEPQGAFFALLNAKIASLYDTTAITELHSSADGAGWCKNNGLQVVSPSAKATHHLDCFHLNREIRRAFGGFGKRASYFIQLAYKKKTKKMMADLERIIAHCQRKDKERYLAFKTYLLSLLPLIACGCGPSMGTMEGTNAHVYAARMKVWGGAWSREGAEAMAAIRARIASGEELIYPVLDNVLYDDFQVKRRTKYEQSLYFGTWKVKESEGRGYEPPRGEVVINPCYPSRYHGLLKYH